MKILVVGGGGREHAIIKSLKKSPRVTEIYAAPGNGGIAADAICTGIGAKDLAGITTFAKDNAIDFAVVAPDDPLVLGAVDLLEEAGIACFGPNKAAAILEGSKVFSKDLMKKYHIPTAEYRVFDNMDEALDYLKTAPIPTVVKADGLALGKGVTVAMTRPGGGGGSARLHGGQNLWRERQPHCHRGVPDGPRGLGSLLYRWQGGRSHGLLHGP